MGVVTGGDRGGKEGEREGEKEYGVDEPVSFPVKCLAKCLANSNKSCFGELGKYQGTAFSFTACEGAKEGRIDIHRDW